ncbi:MAG TPA: protein lplB, partial [Clostridiaceae bacterium]|nr:protein lplB [Clostridiaceae bacterium]
MRKRGFEKYYYLMLLPGMIWLFMFSIVPMFGIVMAFENFNPGAGIFHSRWVGLDNFKYMFQLNDSKTVIANTIIIAVGKLVFNLLIPLIFALLLNEV